MIYVPTTEHTCYVIMNSDTIRAYHTMPTLDTIVNYTDYYINSNYIEQPGYQQFSKYSTLPTCINKTMLTSEVYYRNDFDSILIIFICLCLIFFYIPLKIFKRFFRRFN